MSFLSPTKETQDEDGRVTIERKPTRLVPPRVGGILVNEEGKEVEVWVGGSNITTNQLDGPADVNCRRPKDYKGASICKAACIKGLPDEHKLKDSSEANNILLNTWISMIKEAMISLGMDTVFRVLTVENSRQNEVFILEEWTRVESIDIEQWEKVLLAEGLTNETGEAIKPCFYDKQNLTWSGKFILASISNQLFTMVISNLGDTAPSGPRTFKEIINITQQLDAMGVRELVDKLTRLRIEKEPAENVETFNQKLRPLATTIANCNGASDLDVLVAKTYINTSVDAFKIEALQNFNDLNQRCKSHRWDQTLQKHVYTYRRLVALKEWPPALGKQSNMQLLQNKVNALQTKVENGNNNSKTSQNNSNSGNSDENSVHCYDCGKKNVKKGHEGCTQPGRSLHIPKKLRRKMNNRNNGSSNDNQGSNGKLNLPPVPKEGEPESFTYNGQEWKYCKKCRRGRGFFHKADSPNAHVTAEHDPSKRTKTQGLCITMLSDADDNKVTNTFCQPVGTSLLNSSAPKPVSSLILDSKSVQIDEEDDVEAPKLFHQEDMVGRLQMFPSISNEASELTSRFQELYEDDEVPDVIPNLNFVNKQDPEEPQNVKWAPEVVFKTRKKKTSKA